MTTVNFTGQEGLAYPPNEVPELEEWMESVRKTLGKLLVTVTGGPQILSLDLDQDAGGNVTASITPNLSTEWIKYHVLTTGFPTITQIDTSGVSIDMTDLNRGVTQNTGTIITLTDTQIAYVGVLAYQADDGVTGTGAVSTPVYAKITFGLATVDTDTIVPTLQIEVTVTAGVGKVSITPNDPGGFIDQYEFKLWDGVEWGAYAIEGTGPPFEETIALQEKRDVAIGWKVRYDLELGDGDVFIEDAVIFDTDTIPEFSFIGIDQDLGVVTISYTGDDDLEQVRWQEVLSPTAYPLKAAVELEATNIVVGRQNTFTVGSITVGQTRRVTVVAERTNTPTNFGNEVVQLEITRPPDTDADQPPIVVEVTSETNSIGTLDLTVTDPQGADLTVRFYTRVGTEDTWSAADTRTSVTSGTTESDTVGLDEEKTAFIRYEVDNLAGFTVGGIVAFDADLFPNFFQLGLAVDDGGVVSAHWIGDSDFASIKVLGEEGSVPSATNVRAETAVAGRVGSDSTIAVANTTLTLLNGETAFVRAFGYSTAGGGDPESKVLAEAQITFRTDTDTDTVPPSFTWVLSEPTATTRKVVVTVIDPSEVQIDDPNGFEFRTLENQTFSAWTADSAPYESTVTIEEKHDTASEWRILYDTGSGTEYVYGSQYSDADNTPELSSISLHVEPGTGATTLEWVGDDDVDHIRYKLLEDSGTGPYPSLTGDDVDGTRDPTSGSSRSEQREVDAAMAEDDTQWVTVYAYNSDGDPSAQQYKIKATRPTDTDTQPSTLPEITALSLIVRNTGNVMFHYQGNENVLSIQWAERNDATGAWASAADAYTDAKAATGNIEEGRSDINILVESAMPEGDRHYVSIVAYDAAGGQPGGGVVSEIAYIDEVFRGLEDIGNADLEDLNDVIISGIGTSELLQWNGNDWINQTIAEIGLEPDLGNPGTTGFHLSSTTGGTRSWVAAAGGANEMDDLTDVNIGTPGDQRLLLYDIDPAKWGDVAIDLAGDNGGIAEKGKTLSITGLWSFENAITNIGGSAASPDIIITDDGTRDPRIRAPAGKMTLETQGSTNGTGDGLYIDDGNASNAKIASVKEITASTTPPTGDFPWGTFHCIY